MNSSLNWLSVLAPVQPLSRGSHAPRGQWTDLTPAQQVLCHTVYRDARHAHELPAGIDRAARWVAAYPPGHALLTAQYRLHSWESPLLLGDESPAATARAAAGLAYFLDAIDARGLHAQLHEAIVRDTIGLPVPRHVVAAQSETAKREFLIGQLTDHLPSEALAHYRETGRLDVSALSFVSEPPKFPDTSIPPPRWSMGTLRFRDILHLLLDIDRLPGTVEPIHLRPYEIFQDPAGTWYRFLTTNSDWSSRCQSWRKQLAFDSWCSVFLTSAILPKIDLFTQFGHIPIHTEPIPEDPHFPYTQQWKFLLDALNNPTARTPPYVHAKMTREQFSRGSNNFHLHPNGLYASYPLWVRLRYRRPDLVAQFAGVDTFRRDTPLMDLLYAAYEEMFTYTDLACLYRDPFFA